jgi:hypothetical protein
MYNHKTWYAATMLQITYFEIKNINQCLQLAKSKWSVIRV